MSTDVVHGLRAMRALGSCTRGHAAGACSASVCCIAAGAPHENVCVRVIELSCAIIRHPIAPEDAVSIGRGSDNDKLHRASAAPSAIDHAAFATLFRIYRDTDVGLGFAWGEVATSLVGARGTALCCLRSRAAHTHTSHVTPLTGEITPTTHK